MTPKMTPLMAQQAQFPNAPLPNMANSTPIIGSAKKMGMSVQFAKPPLRNMMAKKMMVKRTPKVAI